MLSYRPKYASGWSIWQWVLLMWCLTTQCLCSGSNANKWCLSESNPLVSKVRRRIRVDGQLVPLRIVVHDWYAHRLLSEIYAILAHDVLGYTDVQLLEHGGTHFGRWVQLLAGCDEFENPSDCRSPSRAPDIMVNIDSWTTGRHEILNAYVQAGNLVENLGGNGLTGRVGLYALAEPELFWTREEVSLDHWRAYRLNKTLQHFLQFDSNATIARFVNENLIFCHFVW